MTVPNISVGYYDNRLDVGFDCVGVMSCKYALCEEMPPVHHDDRCGFERYNSCQCIDAQIAAIQALKRRLTKHIKTMS